LQQPPLVLHPLQPIYHQHVFVIFHALEPILVQFVFFYQPIPQNGLLVKQLILPSFRPTSLLEPFSKQHLINDALPLIASIHSINEHNSQNASKSFLFDLMINDLDCEYI
jgi:hypothetical protein